ncbi:MAG: hypothetical protein O3B41_10795 [Bacteroidetes bacterium]|nr:hypothetical protein [Bacteroidota bacterium]
MKNVRLNQPVMIKRQSTIGSIKTLCIVFAVILASCDASNPAPVVELLPISDTEAILSNGRLSLKLKASGALQSIRFIPVVTEPNRLISIGGTLGMWISGFQNGIRANVSGNSPSAIDQFSLRNPDSENSGLFVVNRGDFLAGFENWQDVLGAPTHSDGSPKMNGDVMAWGALTSTPTTGIPGNSFSGLDIVVNPYLFEDDDLKSTLFIRFYISNESSIPVENLHLGFGGDVDLFWSDPANPPCGRLNPGWNQTGYDLDRHYSFTYVKPEPNDGDLPSNCFGTMVGYSIVGSSSAHSIQAPILAHTVLTRTPEAPFQAFNETEIKTPSQVLFALSGLSSEGAPMIDPSSGEATAFAYTGNPITNTGWVDTRKDVRSLQSISPITLAPGEKIETIVAIFTVSSPTFEQGYEDLATLYDKVMSLRSKWDYEF